MLQITFDNIKIIFFKQKTKVTLS